MGYGFRPWESDFEDWKQEGRLGLLEGCARFRFTPEFEGIRPLTYLSKYVKSFIRSRIIECGQVVRLPGSLYKKGGRRVGTRHVRCFSEMDFGYQPEWEDAFEDSLTDPAPLAEEVFAEHQLEGELPRLVAYLVDKLGEKQNLTVQGLCPPIACCPPIPKAAWHLTRPSSPWASARPPAPVCRDVRRQVRSG